jgi:hypothetical protein
MDATQIEVRRILPEGVPVIRIRTRLSLRLRRVVGHYRRVLSAACRAIRSLFPRRAYLTLE